MRLDPLPKTPSDFGRTVEKVDEDTLSPPFPTLIVPLGFEEGVPRARQSDFQTAKGGNDFMQRNEGFLFHVLCSALKKPLTGGSLIQFVKDIVSGVAASFQFGQVAVGVWHPIAEDELVQDVELPRPFPAEGCLDRLLQVALVQ